LNNSVLMSPLSSFACSKLVKSKEHINVYRLVLLERRGVSDFSIHHRIQTHFLHLLCTYLAFTLASTLRTYLDIGPVYGKTEFATFIMAVVLVHRHATRLSVLRFGNS
jgi:hypothetical protein